MVTGRLQWKMMKAMTEEKIGQVWLDWERQQVRNGERRTLPCDLSENRSGHESWVQSNEFNDDQIKILQILEEYGASSSIELGKKLNKKSVSVSLLAKKLISQNKVKKVGMTDQRGSRRGKTPVWIYDVVEENDE